MTENIYDPQHILPKPLPKPKVAKAENKLKEPKGKDAEKMAQNSKSAKSRPPEGWKRGGAKTQKSRFDGSVSLSIVDSNEPIKLRQRRAELAAAALTSPKSELSAWIPEGLEVLHEHTKFLFQIERNPSSLGATVYKSYDLYLKNGTRIFTVVNHSSRGDNEEFTEYRMIGADGEAIITFEQPVPTWGDEDCLYCCPRAHDSDGIRVLFREREIGFITVEDWACKPCIFFGWRARPCCSRYHNSYLIHFVDGEGDVRMASTRGFDHFGLEIIADDGQILGEISIAPNSNRRVNLDASPDFMLALRNVYIHPNGKVVLLGLALRHLNVLFAHNLTPAMLKYGIPTAQTPKRPKPTSI